MKNLINGLLLLGVITMPFYLSGCGGGNTKATQTGGLGAIAGGALGALLGDKPGREKEGVILGSLIGGGLGTYIGSRMDQQALALQQIPGVANVQVSKETGNQKLGMQMQVQFNVNAAQVKASEQPKLDQLANVLAKYPENIVMIEGHTDNSGEANYNQNLSEQRANSITAYLRGKNLNIASLTSAGYGEARPTASNDTKEGRAMNRRVEINITVDQAKASQLYERKKGVSK